MNENSRSSDLTTLNFFVQRGQCLINAETVQVKYWGWRSQKLCPKFLCHLRGSPQPVGSFWGCSGPSSSSRTVFLDSPRGYLRRLVSCSDGGAAAGGQFKPQRLLEDSP